MVIQFPNPTERHDISVVRDLARRHGWGVSVVRAFIQHGCPRSEMNDLAEAARRQRMNLGHGPKGAA
jgi:hypothetical protein